MAKVYLGTKENQEKIISDLNSKGSLYNQNEIISNQNSLSSKIDRQSSNISSLLKKTGAVKSVQQGHLKGNSDGRHTVMHSEVDLNKSILLINSETSKGIIEERYSTKFEVTGVSTVYSFYWQLIEFY